MKPSEALFPILLAGTACSSGPERPETMYYYDQDEDGFGDEALPRTYQEKVCAPNEKLVLTPTRRKDVKLPGCVASGSKNKFKAITPQAGDCNDTEATVNPAQNDIDQNRVDNDCDGVVDFQPVPEGIDGLREAYRVNGILTLSPTELSWLEALPTLTENCLDLNHNFDYCHPNLGLPSNSELLDNSKVQEALWGWALPHLEVRLGAMTGEKKAAAAATLCIADQYASQLAQPDYLAAEHSYYATLEGMSCTGVFLAPDEEGKIDFSNPSDCTRFFNHYTPTAEWGQAIYDAKGRAKRLPENVKTQGFVFVGPGVQVQPSSHRLFQTQLYRLVDERGIDAGDLAHWTARVRKDLSNTVGYAECRKPN